MEPATRVLEFCILSGSRLVPMREGTSVALQTYIQRHGDGPDELVNPPMCVSSEGGGLCSERKKRSTENLAELQHVVQVHFSRLLWFSRDRDALEVQQMHRMWLA
ncbi:hypothetical protein KP509_33G046600 [Ceratopteris richardii]|uniref:Uncharacterized protein n=1 Tax=Ceratopteris richardii TaxID=49495 RepID=A0A8T2QR22_CERRI|nr:hypothetical protein KP509_33G046600 [Ceratopteris richardii]